MTYRIAFYCPDRHILYDGRTPYQRGVGGGISARVRMGRALRRAGNQVTMVVNCPERVYVDGIEFIPLDEVDHIEADVLMHETSGGDLDLSPALTIQRQAKLKLVWSHGITKPKGLEEIGFDCLYAVSNFIAEVARMMWDLPMGQIFVGYNAFEEGLFVKGERWLPERDPHRLVYFSHPSKGLEAALGVLRLLRERDERFHLMVFGGWGLWGQDEVEAPAQEGVIYRGLVGQEVLIQELLSCSYSINLQSRQEPGALSIGEAQRAGCVIVASPVGCYREYIENGRDGFLIAGDHQDPAVHRQAADLISTLSRNANAVQYIRRNAQSILWDSDRMARVWMAHWDWWLQKQKIPGALDATLSFGRCGECGEPRLWLEDGYHCTGCGRYDRDLRA